MIEQVSSSSGATVGLTKNDLATHDAIQQNVIEEGGGVDSNRGEEGVEESLASSSAYSLIETSHPVFGRVKRLWNSPLESHREVSHPPPPPLTLLFSRYVLY